MVIHELSTIDSSGRLWAHCVTTFYLLLQILPDFVVGDLPVTGGQFQSVLDVNVLVSSRHLSEYIVVSCSYKTVLFSSCKGYVFKISNQKTSFEVVSNFKVILLSEDFSLNLRVGVIDDSQEHVLWWRMIDI